MQLGGQADPKSPQIPFTILPQDIYPVFPPILATVYFPISYQYYPNSHIVYGRTFFYPFNSHPQLFPCPFPIVCHPKTPFLNHPYNKSSTPDRIEVHPPSTFQPSPQITDKQSAIIHPQTPPSQKQTPSSEPDDQISEQQVSLNSESSLTITADTQKSQLLKDTVDYLKFPDSEDSWRANSVYKLASLKRLVLSVYTCEDQRFLSRHLEQHPIPLLLIILNFKKAILSSPQLVNQVAASQYFVLRTRQTHNGQLFI